MLTSATLLQTLPLAAAEAPAGPPQGGYGQQLKLGDTDYMPVTKGVSLALSVNEMDLGIAGQVTDNCLLIDTGSTASAGAQQKDVRLTPCLNYTAGTLIDTTFNTIETSTPYPNVVGANVQYADVNNNNKYDKGDWVYITTQASGLTPSTATGTWTVRLTPVGNYSAGTFVLPGDTDLLQYATFTKALTSSVVERDDGGYFLIPLAAAQPKFIPLPQYSLRLTAGALADVRPSGIGFTPATPVVGQPFQVSVDVQNYGKVPGSGTVVTQLNGVTVDARATPWLNGGSKATLVMTLVAPLAPGSVNLTVAPVNLVVQIVADPNAALASSSPVNSTVTDDLAKRVGSLETQLTSTQQALASTKADLQSAEASLAKLQGLQAKSTGPADTAASSGTATTLKSPGPDTGLLLLGFLGAVALASRARRP